MPITTSFDPYTPEVITPAQTIQPVEGFPDTIIVTFQPKTIATLEQEYDTRPVTRIVLEEAIGQDQLTTPGNVHTFSHNGRTLGAYLSPIGAPGTVAAMEQAIAHGARRFVVFGTCGALVPGVAVGGVIVPTAAYRDEGTSYHYAAPSDYLAVATAAKTEAVLTELGVPHTLGRVWTTDAFYRETQSNMAKRVAEGCVAVDMETSALAALAQFRNVAIHHFLYAADNLINGWDPGILGSLPAEPRARYVRIAAELAVRL